MNLQIAIAFLLGALLFLSLVVLAMACIGAAFIWMMAARVYEKHYRRKALREIKKARTRKRSAYPEAVHLIAPAVIEPLRRENNGG